jgi:transcriptional regulator with XRE-family HTH domain
MASRQADEMVKAMADILRERRLEIGASMNALASSSYLDRAALHRAEAGERIPSLAFWIDWADTLGTSLEEVMKQARKRAGKTAGEPPERKPLLLGGCFLREAPEGAIGSDRRAGKWGLISIPAAWAIAGMWRQAAARRLLSAGGP